MQTEVRLNITRRVNFAEGDSFGSVGPYERLVGTVAFAVDPAHPTLGDIMDLDLALRNSQGLVEFSADLDILKPVDLVRGNGRLLYDVNNRGNRIALRSFSDAVPSPDPSTLAHAGNGFLMRQGYTVVWSGWQGDLVPGGGLLVAHLPEARHNGQPLRGWVRQEFVVDQEGVLSMPLSGAPTVRSYPALDLDTRRATLTIREHEHDTRLQVPPQEWALARAQRDRSSGQETLTPSRTDCYVKGGFRPGWIYEITYETEGSLVMGLGPVGVRDLVSFLRHESVDANGTANPLSGAIEKAYAYGVSLSARMLRQFIYDGYNADTQGQQVFDAVCTHLSGGGRLFLNMRFAQVGRFPRQHEEHQWPSEYYPFAYVPVPDPFSENVDSILKRPQTDPLVMHIHSSTEYWQRHASTGHTDSRTGEDLEDAGNVRMYLLTGAPHAAGGGPLPHLGQLPPNNLSAGPLLRAALMLMDRWASQKTPPPPSRLPRHSSGTLAPPEEMLARFPSIRGVNLPHGPSRLPKYDYGPDFPRQITKHPPLPTPGQQYLIQVPLVDADGNELAGVRSPDIEVPLGTYTGWSVRKAGYAEGELLSLTGSFIPFCRTKAEREATGDPRPSVEERYQSHAAYIRAVARAVERLMAEGLLLGEDADRYIAAAVKRNPLDPSTPLGPILAE